jgi:hypothetical protein
MAFAKGIDVIISKMKQLNTPYYGVYEMDGKTLLSENDGDDINSTEAAEELETFLNSIEGSVKVILRINSKKSKSQGGATNGSHIFSIRLGDEKQKGVNGMDQTIMGLLQSNFDAKIAAMKSEYEHQEQLRKIKESNDDSQSTISEILEHLKPFIPHIMQKLGMMPTLSVSGATDDVIEQKIDQNTISRLNIAIADLIKIDPSFVDTLETLAKFAKQSPDQYKSFIPILMSQVK